ncbi:MAG: NAD+ synthase [Methylococcales bacterium]
MKLSIALAQLNLVVGDIDGNAQRIIETARYARDDLNAHAVVFPELALTGYPPEDLLLRNDFLENAEKALDHIGESIRGIDMVVGFPERAEGLLHNSAAVLRDGKIKVCYRKQVLPNYGVFDEKRYFSPGKETGIFQIEGVPVALSLCEDVWTAGVVEQSAKRGAKLLLNLNASPFHGHKIQERQDTLEKRVCASDIPAIYVNLVGGQDELVFDGASFVMSSGGEVVFRAPEFEESIDVIEFNVNKDIVPVPGQIAPAYDEITSDYKALVMGVRDYVKKNGFHGAVLGLSGGIDSAITLAIAVDALGENQVEVVLMPSRYTADMSNEDAIEEAKALGVEYHIVPIEPAFQAFQKMLKETFSGMAADVTEENIQARCRGIILMAISNKKGKLLLTTGNKSEMSVGYATLYGDMAGGFAPIKDTPKLLVYKLAEYRNSISPVIPQRVIDRPPSAELAPDQVDQDSLPSYEILDGILAMYVEQDKSPEEIIAAGFPESDVLRTIRLVDRNEYKRRQAPPGVRITSRSFGRDRRYPITSGYKQTER